MPMYEYKCKQCGQVFERLRFVSEKDEKTECPHCRSTKTDRLPSRFSTGGCETTGSAFS
jgi:putative FmdB family regulatory protein